MSESWVPLGQLTRCDSCGHEWYPRVRVKRDRLLGESWQFRCPHCSRRFDMARITPKGVELRAELNRVRTDEAMDPEERARRIDELLAAVKAETTGGIPAAVEEVVDGGGGTTSSDGGRGT